MEYPRGDIAISGLQLFNPVHIFMLKKYIQLYESMICVATFMLCAMVIMCALSHSKQRPYLEWGNGFMVVSNHTMKEWGLTENMDYHQVHLVLV